MIALRGVSKRFRDGDRAIPVLRGVDLSVAQGELVAIIGASGSGKSTLLYILGALDRDFEGEVEIAGRSLRRLSVAERADLRNRSIGFVFQSFNLLPGLSALENVMLPGMLRRDGPDGRTAALRARAAEALARVGLQDRAHAPPARLSGGERQRVAIARALFTGPAVLLADEPTGNLDSTTSEEIMRVFEGLAEQGQTVIMVTHESDIAAHARRVIVLRDGLVSSDDKRATFIKSAGIAPPNLNRKD
jgi:putative ABC transport system ATP-binding protein